MGRAVIVSLHDQEIETEVMIVIAWSYRELNIPPAPHGWLRDLILIPVFDQHHSDMLV